MILDKPSGIAVHGGTGLNYGVIDIVRAMRPHARRVELVHRLDRETSGCLVLAKDPASLRDIQEQLRHGMVEKRYTALLQGRISSDDTRIAEKLRWVRDEQGERRTRVSANGRAAETRLQPSERLSGATLVAVQLLTGRTHQIRSHAAHIGHPVAGDRRYGDPGFNRALRAVGLRRLFLHASRIRLQPPDCPAPLCVDAPMPAELNDVLERLRTT
jgi:23S rRNA pseudouridine955/2504/2580 synthase